MTAICAALISSVPSSALELPIGSSFSEGAAQDLGPEESAGAPGYQQANWNNLGPAVFGGPVALVDGNGAVTPVNVKWDAPNFWRNNSNETLGGDNKLMKGYADSNGAPITEPFGGVSGTNDDKPTILIRGLDTWMAENGLSSYSVVVYSDGDSGDGTRAARIWLAATDSGNSVNGDPGLGADLTPRVNILDASNWGDSPNFVRVTGTSGTGNFTVFSAVTAESIYIRAEEAGPAALRSPINGFQIIGSDTTVNPEDDSDGDGLPDLWEILYGLDPEDDGSVDPDNGGDGDPDNDGRTNAQELDDGTDPRNPDTDGDGLNDGEEAVAGTDPLIPDTDDDGLPDGWEVTYTMDPLDDGTIDIDNGPEGDPDEDFLSNFEELLRGTDPRNPDTDGDGLSDFAEDNQGLWFGSDLTGTDPSNPDTDGDGFLDGQENPDEPYVAGVTPGTDPNLADTDGDGFSDRWEFLLGTDPTLDGSSLPIIPVSNHGFEFPDVAGAWFDGVPDSWILMNGPATNDSFVEDNASVGFSGGEGLQHVGIGEIGAYLYKDAGVAFSPDTTYLVDLASALRPGFASGIVEFGLFSSDAVGTDLGYPGWMDIGGILPASGNPDADNVVSTFRDASILANIGSGALGRPYSLVTGATPPGGNIVVFIRHVSGARVAVDNVRIIEIPNSLDGDGDGLPDGWELANNLDPTANGSSSPDHGPDGDPDGDGLTNAQELAAGTDPQSANNIPTDGGPIITSTRFNGTAFEITVEALDPITTYTLARSGDLTAFIPIGETVTGVATHTFSDDPAPEGSSFYRIEEAVPAP